MDSSPPRNDAERLAQLTPPDLVAQLARNPSRWLVEATLVFDLPSLSNAWVTTATACELASIYGFHNCTPRWIHRNLHKIETPTCFGTEFAWDGIGVLRLFCELTRQRKFQVGSFLGLKGEGQVRTELTMVREAFADLEYYRGLDIPELERLVGEVQDEVGMSALSLVLVEKNGGETIA